jgi:hypothetical protein
MYALRRTCASFLSCFAFPVAILACTLSASAQTQPPGLLVNGAALTPGSTVSAGTWSSTSSSVSSIAFSFTQPATITSLAFDPGPGGAQELAVERAYLVGDMFGTGCSTGTLSAGQQCAVEAALSPLYPGERSGTLRITTSSGVYVIPVTFTAANFQTALTPGTFTSPAIVGGVPIQTAATTLSVDAVGNVYLAYTPDTVVRKVDATTGATTIVAGTVGNSNDSGDGGPATSAGIQHPVDITVSPAGDLYILSVIDNANDPIRKVDYGTGNISTVGSEASGRVGAVHGTTADGEDGGIAVDANGYLYTAVPTQGQIQVSKNGTVTTIVQGAQYLPSTLAVRDGYLYFISHHQVFKISTDTTQPQPVILVAGTGVLGNSTGDGGPATSAQLGNMSGLAFDAAGNLYVADYFNNNIRMVNAFTGTISTIAGTGSSLPNINVGGGLSSLAIDFRGNLYLLSTPPVVQKIDVSQATLVFGSTAVGATSTDSPQGVTLTNIGNAALPAGLVPQPPGFAFDPSSTCLDIDGNSSALAAAASCTAAFDFKPITSSEQIDQVQIGGSSIHLVGNASANNPISVSPHNFTFGTVTLGSANLTAPITITNTGTKTLNVTTSFDGGSNFTLNGSCASIPVGSSCTVNVVFTPTTPGTFNGSYIVRGDTFVFQLITFTATVIAPDIGISPNNINFGTVGVGQQSPTWTIWVGNNSSQPMAQLNTVLGPSSQFSITKSTCGQSLPAYSSCLVSVVFTPTAAQTFTSQLLVQVNPNNVAGQVASFPVPLAGTGAGQPPPVVDISPSPIDFGNVPVGSKSGTWNVWIGNESDSTLNVSSVKLSDTTNFTMTNNCTVVAAWGSCTATVVFNPQATGSFSGTITLTDNASPATQTIVLSGKGTSPSFSVNATPSTMTLHAGDTGAATFAFLPTGGFTGTVTFACSNLPASVNCSFSPATLTADGSDTVQKAKLTITTSALAASNNTRNGVLFAGLLGLGGLFALRRRKRALPALLATVFALAGLAMMSGCGSGILGGLTSSGAHPIAVNAVATSTQLTQTGTANTGTSTQTAPFTLTIVQ